jgi:hypothetical protein
MIQLAQSQVCLYPFESQAMPDCTVLDHRLTVHHARSNSGMRLLSGNLHLDGFAKHPRLAANGDHFFRVRVFYKNVAHHSKDPFGRLNDVISKVATTTGQLNTSVRTWHAESSTVALAATRRSCANAMSVPIRRRRTNMRFC